MLCNCGCKNNCLALSVVGSLILGIIAAFLNFTAVIAVTPAFLWVVFGIAVVYLAILLVTTSFIRSRNIWSCLCQILPVLLLSILGTAFLGVLLLAVPAAATGVPGAVLVGALVALFFLLLSSAACYVKCTAGCDDCETDNASS